MREGVVTFENKKHTNESTVIKSVIQKSINNKQVDEIYALKQELENTHEKNKKLELENKRLMIEVLDLKHKLENTIINTIRLINKEKVTAFETEKMMSQMKKNERNHVNLKHDFSKLENEYTELNKRYKALRESKLGKITIRYWKIKNRIKGGR